MEEDDDTTSLSSFISVGTAEVRPMSSMRLRDNDVNPLPTPVATTTATNPTLAELIDMHRPPAPPSPVSSHCSLDTMHHLNEKRESTQNRDSIIAPSTVKISFVGSMSDVPLVLPLEEGLQRLYKLYQENDPAPSPLPRQVQITDVPLTTIAESLESHILEMRAALTDCAANIENLNLTNDKTKKDLVNLEFAYCLARQEANICHMSTDDFRLRLAWQKEEIARVNNEKEVALAANLAYAKEITRVRKELNGVAGVREENKKLKQVNKTHEEKLEELQGQLDEVRKCLDDARFALKSVPAPIQKLCGKVLVPQDGKPLENGVIHGPEKVVEIDQRKDHENTARKKNGGRRKSRSFF